MIIESPELVDEIAVEDASLGESSAFLLSAEDRATIRVLVIDDEQTILDSCESVLTTEGYQVTVERRADEALQRLASSKFEIVIIDQNMPQTNGFDILDEVRRRRPNALSLMMTGHATPEASVRAMQAGAWEYLPKPFTATQLLVLIGRAAHTLVRMRTLAGESQKEGVLIDKEVRILGVSASMRDAVNTALKVAGTDASVFITGESGTGKEIIAQCIHAESRRSRKPFVAVNCAALPGELLESEMFGHKRGAFTGAVRDKAGLLEIAHQGTFFLDELAEMPMPLQAKLLRVLQDGVVRRVGSEKADAVVDVRFISATNRVAEDALEQGMLRHDLYYRLRVVPIHLPPLRERPEDIPVLITRFVEHFWRRHQPPGKVTPRLAPETLDALVRYRWPGNVRELQNVIEHLVVLSDPDEIIDADRLSILSEEASNGGGSSQSAQGFASSVNFRDAFHDAKQRLVDRFEREYLAQVVARTGGNMSEAARQAGIDRTTLYRLMEKHRLSKDAFSA